MLAEEPGIGKTRTTTELAAYAKNQGAQVHLGWCYEGEGAPPYRPRVQAIRSYAGQRDAGQLRTEMGPGASDIAEMVPELRVKLPDLESPLTLEPDRAFQLYDEGELLELLKTQRCELVQAGAPGELGELMYCTDPKPVDHCVFHVRKSA